MITSAFGSLACPDMRRIVALLAACLIRAGFARLGLFCCEADAIGLTDYELNLDLSDRDRSNSDTRTRRPHD